MKLAGRNAIITGASQGFGEHIARHFVQEGASVLLAARTASQLDRVQRELSGMLGSDQSVETQVVDVAVEGDVDRMMDDALSRFSQIHILVNCAGVVGPRAPIQESNWDEWKQANDINLYGTVYPCRQVVPHMLEKGYGKILNISGGGATQPLPCLSAYGASKAGMVRFSETLAEELSGTGIDVNSIAPGVLATRIMEQFLEVKEHIPGYEEKAEEQRENSLPGFQLASELCVYLASGDSDGITGKLISAKWDPWEDFQKYKQDLNSTDIYTLRRIVPEDRNIHWSKESR